MLQNAVKPIHELHAIQTTSEQLISSTGTKQPYKTHVLLLTTAAQRLDNTTLSTRARRSANAREFFPESQELTDEQLPGNGEIVDDEEYTINLPVNLILANAHARLPRQPTGFNHAARLSKEVFHTLSSDRKQHWRAMQAKDKLKILGKTPVGNNNGNDNRFKSNSKPSFKPYVKSDSCSVNLHERVQPTLKHLKNTSPTKRW